MNQQQRTAQEIQRVDRILEQCREQRIDPLEALEKVLQSDQGRQHNGRGDVRAVRRAGLER